MINRIADALAQYGRYGDTELVHMNPEEIRILEQITGANMTTNPATGQREAFSLGKLLAGIGALVAAPFTGGVTLPILATLGGGLLGSGISGGKKKESDVSASDARKYVDALYARRKQQADERGFPIINLESMAPPPNLLGVEQQQFSPTGVAPMGIGALSQRLAQGGIPGIPGIPSAPGMEPEEDQRDSVFSNALDALRGDSDDPQKAFNEFIRMYGVEALRSLSEDAGTPEAPLQKMMGGGKIMGPGAGMDDMITGSIGGNQKVLLSDGEFVVPADVVSGLGDGSSEAGSRELYAMMDRVRKRRTGTTRQPKKLKKGAALPG